MTVGVTSAEDLSEVHCFVPTPLAERRADAGSVVLLPLQIGPVARAVHPSPYRLSRRSLRITEGNLGEWLLESDSRRRRRSCGRS